jgi:hypothetical protein
MSVVANPTMLPTISKDVKHQKSASIVKNIDIAAKI